MCKTRFRSYLDQALFVLLIMAGATASAVVDIRAVAGAMAAGKLGVDPAVVAARPASARPAAATASAGGEGRRTYRATIVARLSR